MKKPTRKPAQTELRSEYAFDYASAKPNRFAGDLKNASVVVLDPDVAAVFTSSKLVNDLLRSAIVATGRGQPAKKSAAGRGPKRRAA